MRYHAIGDFVTKHLGQLKIAFMFLQNFNMKPMTIQCKAKSFL